MLKTFVGGLFRRAGAAAGADSVSAHQTDAPPLGSPLKKEKNGLSAAEIKMIFGR